MLRRSLLNSTNRSLLIRCNSTSNNEAYNAVLITLKMDLKNALLNKDEVKKTTIRDIMATLKNKTIASKNHTINTFDIYATYEKMINQRKESIAEYSSNKREDLVKRERKELKIIEEYQKSLPVISKEELDLKVKELLEFLKKEDPDTQLKGIFNKIDWKVLPSEWNASSNMIKDSIVNQFKEVFSKTK